jgi:hypothetical protein
MFLVFQRLVFFVVGHAKYANSGFKKVDSFGENNELCHERCVRRLQQIFAFFTTNLLLNVSTTCVYKSVAILAASDTFLQSISQKRADTVVVNDTQSFTNDNGVEPVTSSQTALF